MSTSVLTIYQRAAQKKGSRTGTLGTVTVGVSTTTAILDGLVNTTGDDTMYAGDRLFFMESPAGSREALITSWADATGTATFLNRATAPVIAKAYILEPREDYTLNEYDLAWSETLRETRRTYRQVIPITPNARFQDLAVLDWLRGARDVDAVYWNISPITLHNEDFALWQNGASAAPDGWTLSGSNATVARATGGFRSAYKATITTDDATGLLVQAMPTTLVQWITRRVAAVYTPIRAAAWLETAYTNKARVGIRTTASGVTTTTWSDYATGDGRPHFMETSVTPTADMTAIECVISVGPAASGSVSAAVLMQNTTTAGNSYQLRDQGSQFYSEARMNVRVRNMGGVPTLELQSWPNVPGQLIVYSRRPMPALTAYTDVVDDEYARAMEWGLLSWLLRANKPNQDRARLDAIMADAQREWARFTSNISDLPVGDPPVQVTVMGA